jgi:hypothetical protein
LDVSVFLHRGYLFFVSWSVRRVVRLVRMGFGKDAAASGLLTMTTLTTKSNIARAVFFWFAIIFLGFALWRLFMPPNPRIDRPVMTSLWVAPLVLVCSLGIRRIRQARQKQ